MRKTSSNPMLKESRFLKNAQAQSSGKLMTVNGTVNKSYIMFFCLLGGGGFAWLQIIAGGGALLLPLLGIGSISAFLMVLLTQFKPHWAPITAPIYAVIEGILLGTITLFAETYVPGIGTQAIGLTLGILFVMLGLYKWGIIKPTEKLKSVIIGATFAIFITYLSIMVLRMGGLEIPYMHQLGWIGIGFSLVIIGVAALNLILDFDLIDQYSQAGVPKYMEWFAAMGLMVTLVWLYVEILRLLSILSSD